MSELYPFLFQPVYKDYIWGGRRIAEEYHRDIEMPICAESWEISDRQEGMSVVTNGTRAGQSLHDLVRELGPRLLGHNRQDKTFPLLIKIIDASRTLSVQVHPHDTNYHLTGGEPKTEMWYFLDSAPEAGIYLGLKSGVSAEDFNMGIDVQDVEPLLNYLPAPKGEAVFVPGGTIHAIASGCLILEVQQNSNTTYRVFDWGRVGHDGKPRELHIDEAIAVTNWDAGPGKLLEVSRETSQGPVDIDLIHSCPTFSMRRLILNGATDRVLNGDGFEVLFTVDNTVRLYWDDDSLTLPKGTSVLIPAELGSYRLDPAEQTAEVLLIRG